MAKKCPPGVVCIENYTITFFILIICGILFYMWLYDNKNKNNKNNTSINNYSTNFKLSSMLPNSSLLTKPSFGYNNNSDDILMNPYAAPLRDDRPILPPPMMGDQRGIPINVPTQGVDSSYRQVGILTRINGPEMILPLMGRPLIPGRDKWNFYTMSDKNNMIKLPITYKSKSCSNEYGCDNVYNGDTVYVEGYNDAFKVTVYENSTMRYIPYI
jgi:hypothetical protein